MNRLAALVLLALAAPSRPATVASAGQESGAHVSGIVTAADTGRPIAGAEVQLQVWSQGERRVAKTDRTGRYDFAHVAPGRYTLSALAARYLPWTSDPPPAAEPLTIRAGDRVEHDLALRRYGAISGRVIDHFGDPVPGVSVVAMRPTFVDGLRRLAPAGGTLPSRPTDDLGRFRLYMLEPAVYYVVALSGPLTAVHPYNESNDTGGFLPTFYPSAGSVREAAAVPLGVGEERVDITIALMPGRGVRVSGKAVDSVGNPFRGLMFIVADDAAAAGALFVGRDSTQANGAFAFSNVPPGAYVVQARSGGTTGRFTGEFGWLNLTVGGNDLSDLLIQTSPGSAVTARLTVESDVPGTYPLGATTTLVPIDLETQPVLPTGSAPVRVTLKGATSRIDFHQVWGRQAFWMMPGQWVVKSVTVGGRDVTDLPIEFRGQPITAEIVVTETAASLSGRVTDERGVPVPGCTVIVFASDRALWTPRSRFVRSATANEEGEYAVRGIVPGRYLAAAVASLEPGRWTDPDFLASLSDAATPFPAIERETRTIDLPLMRAR